jgi:hypothetical protein
MDIRLNSRGRWGMGIEIVVFGARIKDFLETGIRKS